MAWRIHLSDSVVYRIDVLNGTPNIVCVWLSSEEAAFFDMKTGASMGTRLIQAPAPEIERGSDDWHTFLKELSAPNGALLPVVRLPDLTVHRTDDGKYCLYDDGHGVSIAFDGAEHRLGPVDKLFTSVTLDHTAGHTAALDERSKLYLYEQARLTKITEIGLKTPQGILPDIALADGAACIFASDGNQFIRINGKGDVECVVPVAYPIGKIACSRDGKYCAASDTETGIIRVYAGKEMEFTYQKFAIDLFAAATQVQLLADVPTPRLGVSALTITNDGTIAFAMDGIVTVTNVEAMSKMPHSQSYA